MLSPSPQTTRASGPAGQSVLVDADPPGDSPTFRRVPLAPVESARSLPARSTRLILLTCEDTGVTCRSWMPSGARPPGCSLQGPLSRASVIHRQLLPLCRGSPPPLGGCIPAPHLHPAAPCMLAALHPHVTITETHSTGQVHCTVGFEPSSGSPSATVQLACGDAAACRAAPAMGRDTCTCSAWAGRHMLLGEAHALQSHRGCTQDPPPVPRA